MIVIFVIIFLSKGVYVKGVLSIKLIFSLLIFKFSGSGFSFGSYGGLLFKSGISILLLSSSKSLSINIFKILSSGYKLGSYSSNLISGNISKSSIGKDLVKSKFNVVISGFKLGNYSNSFSFISSKEINSISNSI